MQIFFSSLLYWFKCRPHCPVPSVQIHMNSDNFVQACTISNCRPANNQWPSNNSWIKCHGSSRVILKKKNQTDYMGRYCNRLCFLNMNLLGFCSIGFYVTGLYNCKLMLYNWVIALKKLFGFKAFLGWTALIFNSIGFPFQKSFQGEPLQKNTKDLQKMVKRLTIQKLTPPFFLKSVLFKSGPFSKRKICQCSPNHSGQASLDTKMVLIGTTSDS